MKRPAVEQHIPELQESVSEFVAATQTRFADWANRDASALKKAVLRKIAAALPPHAGRPLDPLVTRAVELRAKGLTFDVVCRHLFDKYPSWSRYRQRTARITMQKAVAKRRKALRLATKTRCADNSPECDKGPKSAAGDS